VVYRSVDVSEQCMFMRSSSHMLPCNRLMFMGVAVDTIVSVGQDDGSDKLLEYLPGKEVTT
jgi:hypothetical protein